ncbi:AAA family ATPase [Candidatus Dependentiae bacterium]|nr:AAA family ATPase [Candidatus Dependentiae bacterium]MCC7414474.1 AAA family ATPase [Campylobacterota bacterium]
MKTDSLTRAAQELVNKAALVATQHHNPTLQPIHFLSAAQSEPFCALFFTTLSVPQDRLASLTKQGLEALPRLSQEHELEVDSTTQRFFAACKKEADKLGDTYISLEHIMLALAVTPDLPADIRTFFAQHHFNHATIVGYMATVRNGKKSTEKNAEDTYKILEKYCQNITKLAREGKLDPVIGRHEEIRRVIQILSRRTKNNPVLIGEPGVGKTAIVEGIAQRIVNNDVPESIKGKQIYSLDLGLLIAGAKYQGEFEERLKGVLKEIESNEEGLIIFIDELHMLVGAGSSGGGMDASNLLKPALARGTLHCIGATTLQEYKKYIEKDAALERRFQPVVVEEPSTDDAISILRGLKERYELHHGIRIKDQALVDAVLLSKKYIPDRFLPDKAIDLIDEAASMVKMSIDSQPEMLDKLERTIRQLEIEKLALTKEKEHPASQDRLSELDAELASIKEQHNVLFAQWKAEKAPLERINQLKEKIEGAQQEFVIAERQGDYARASEIKYGRIAKLEQELAKEQETIKHLKTHTVKQEVDEHDIATVLSRATKIPVEKLQESESQKLLEMESVLHKRVIGQDEAVTTIAHAIQMHRTGLTDPNKPIGSFLFLGPTGVGKTEVAKAVADYLFNDSNNIVRIDMSEYMEKHAVARLIGAPPGYVGYEEGGQLTEQVRRHPYSVVLFDEIEKAHADVFNIFLQILDEGHLTDSQGRTVSFKNCIIIMTSNIGSELILSAKELTELVKQSIEKMLHTHFRPEFLNRIDAIVYFKMLTQEDIIAIADIQLNIIKERLKQQAVELTIDDEVRILVADEGYNKEFGARPLKRTIQRLIGVTVSQYILKHPDKKQVHLGVKNGFIVAS